MRIGIDLGGSKVEAAVVDDSGAVRMRLRRPTPRGEYASTLRVIADLVKEIARETGKTDFSIGICTPGAVSPVSGRIMNANSTWLNGQPLQQDLEELLQQPLRLANDADCLAVSESRDGAARDADTAFAAILGTGVGGGIVVNGRLVRGPNAIAGEWGHNPLPWLEANEYPGPRCWCGRTGCIEAWLSGPALAEQFSLLSRDAVHRGSRASPPEVVSMAARGDRSACEALMRYRNRLARALASVVNILDPEVIVLGGGLSNIESLYDQVPLMWQEWVFAESIRTRLVAAAHGDSSGVRGAAWLWDD